MAKRKKDKVTTRAIQIESSEGILLKVVFDKDGLATITMSDKSCKLVFNASEVQTDIIKSSFWDNYRRHYIWKTKAQRKEERRLAALDSFTTEQIERIERIKNNYPLTQEYPSIEFLDLPSIDINLL